MSQPVVNQYQPSLTEWFAALGDIEKSQAFRDEDNTKIDRLEVLYQMIGFSYERPVSFPARELKEGSVPWMQFLSEHGQELCAIRVVPNDPTLPKLRNRGLTIEECYRTWFLRQQIDWDRYTAYICPHTDRLLWSSIIVVSEDALYGEVIKDMHNQLTQGDTIHPPHQFVYDFSTWRWSSDPGPIQGVVERMIAPLRIDDASVQNSLRKSVNAQFNRGFLRGYFEITVWPSQSDHKEDLGIVRFVDYNRILPGLMSVPIISLDKQRDNEHALTNGVSAYPGRAQGAVVIVAEDAIATTSFPKGSILVAANTDIRYLPMMKQAAAVITDKGGLLSHAAIVARELKTPCIVNTKTATTVLQTGDRVEVDATKGVVKKL